MFSARPLGGNPLAVVHDATDVPDDEMRRFAAWTNLSETAFLLPPSDERADYRVLDRRVRVSKPRRLAVFARRLTAAQLARVRVTMAKPNSRSSTGA